MRRLGSGILFLCVAGAALADAGAPAVSRQDDAYHFAAFADGRHDGLFAEWWYFNLVDAEQGVQAIFAYSVVDPSDRTGRGLSSVLAVAYVPGGPVQQGAYLAPAAFTGSTEQADVSVGEGLPSQGRVEVIDEGQYRMLIYGGSDDAGNPLGDVRDFSLNVHTWTTLTPSWALRTSRSSFSKFLGSISSSV